MGSVRVGSAKLENASQSYKKGSRARARTMLHVNLGAVVGVDRPTTSAAAVETAIPSLVVFMNGAPTSPLVTAATRILSARVATA